MEDLEKMHPYEKCFYQGAINKYYEDLFRVVETVVVTYIGDDKARRAFMKKLEKEQEEREEANR